MAGTAVYGKVTVMFGRRTTTLVKLVAIDASAADIYAFLAEPDNSIGLQPLVVAVEELDRAINDEGRSTRRYQSTEKFTFLGFIPYHNQIEVTMTLVAENEVITNEVYSPANVYLHSTYTLVPKNDHTAVTETIHIQSPALIANFVFNTASRAHDTLLANLKARFENDA